jgi:hypothetical protein
MSRDWTELVAALGDLVSLPLLLLALLLLTTAVALLWYFYPDWLPRGRGHRRAWFRPRLRRPHLRLRLRLPTWHRPRLPRLRWPWRRGKRTSEATVDGQIAELLASAEELPTVPSEIYQSLADRLAAEGRYAEAVRERYRAAIRDLVQHGIIDNRPDWTVIELAGEAAAVRPAVGPPLRSASGLFSDVWYAERPATVDHDERMRALTGDVHAHLEGR